MIKCTKKGGLHNYGQIMIKIVSEIMIIYHDFSLILGKNIFIKFHLKKQITPLICTKMFTRKCKSSEHCFDFDDTYLL